jgi:hypothetical protein
MKPMDIVMSEGSNEHHLLAGSGFPQTAPLDLDSAS